MVVHPGGAPVQHKCHWPRATGPSTLRCVAPSGPTRRAAGGGRRCVESRERRLRRLPAAFSSGAATAPQSICPIHGLHGSPPDRSGRARPRQPHREDQPGRSPNRLGCMRAGGAASSHPQPPTPRAARFLSERRSDDRAERTAVLQLVPQRYRQPGPRRRRRGVRAGAPHRFRSVRSPLRTPRCTAVAHCAAGSAMRPMPALRESPRHPVRPRSSDGGPTPPCTDLPSSAVPPPCPIRRLHGSPPGGSGRARPRRPRR